MLTWSYSTLSAFLKCPAQYKAVRVDKLYKYVPMPEAAEGERQHKAFEERIGAKKPLPQNLQHYEPMMAKVQGLPGVKHVELELAITENGTKTRFFADDVWLRGKADIVIDVRPELAIVGDWKGGKSAYADTSQLKLTALMLFSTRPELQIVEGGLLFTKENKGIAATYTRNNVTQYWGEFMPDYLKMQRAHQENVFPEKPSGLCRRCPHKVCRYNRSEG